MKKLQKIWKSLYSEENEDLDNVREDLNLITEIPDTGIFRYVGAG